MFQVPLNPPLDPQGRFHSKAEKEPSTLYLPRPSRGGAMGGVCNFRFQSCAIKPMNSNLSSNIVQRFIFASPLCPPSPLRTPCFHSKAEKECSKFRSTLRSTRRGAFIAKRRKNPQRSTFPAPQGEGPWVGSVISGFSPVPLSP